MNDDPGSPGRAADRLPSALGGAGAGLAAWLVGYALTYALTVSRVRASLLNRLAGALSGQATDWRIVGWIFYNAHVVDTRVDVGIFGSGAVNFVGEGSFSPVLYVVPPVLLVLAGALVGRFADVDATAGGVALAGGSIVAGYLVLTLVGLVVFPVAAGGASAGPAPVPAVVLAGLVYPAVFGGAGVSVGAWAGDTGRRRGTR